jgi:hypothetical protein
MNRFRGTIIKTPGNSPGLVVVGGQQKSFLLAGVWKSSVAPAAKMSVDVEVDSSGAIASIGVVSRWQLVKERLGRISGKLKDRGK